MNFPRSSLTRLSLLFLAAAVAGTVLLFRRPSLPSPTSAAARASLAEIPAAPSNVAKRLDDFSAKVRERLACWKAETDPLKQNAIHVELLTLLTDANAGEIVRALSPDLLETPFGEIALTRWASLERRAAAEWMAGIPGATDYQAGLVAYGWLKDDREGLHAYLATLPQQSPWKQSLLKVTTNDALLFKDGREAIGLLLQLPLHPQRDEMLGWGTTEWAKADPDAAARWAQQLSDPLLQRRMFDAVVVGYAWKNPRQAAELLINAGRDEASGANTLSSLMNIWSSKEPETATRWAVERLDDASQVLALRSTLLAWGTHDLPAARMWTQALSPGALRSQAERTLRKVEAAQSGVEFSDE